MAADPLPRLRRACLALAEAHEVTAWGEPPERFFVPPYVGPGGWVGVWLDRRVRWTELGGLLADGYRMVAPRRLLPPPSPARPRRR